MIAITEACEQRGLTLTRLCADKGASGKSMAKRAGLQEAIEALRSGEASVLVVSKLDRLSRSVIDFAKLLERATHEGWEIVVLDINVDMTTVHGELIANIIASVAQ